MLGRSSPSDPFVRTEALSYMPTQKGRAVFRSIDRKGYDGSTVEVPALCVATGVIDRVVRWTDPADVLGRTLTTVKYTVVGKDLADGGSPADRARLARPVEQTVTLQRTNDGWAMFDSR